MAAQKRMSAGQIINALRKAEVGIANGKRIKEVCRELGVSEQTYYRWRREYGGMKTSQARRLKELEKETQLLKRAVADLTLDNLRSSPELCVKVRGSSSMLLLGCLGDLLRFEKREIQVATFAPDRSSP